jgi:hypothetical protein
MLIVCACVAVAGIASVSAKANAKPKPKAKPAPAAPSCAKLMPASLVQSLSGVAVTIAPFPQSKVASDCSYKPAAGGSLIVAIRFKATRVMFEAAYNGSVAASGHKEQAECASASPPPYCTPTMLTGIGSTAYEFLGTVVALSGTSLIQVEADPTSEGVQLFTPAAVQAIAKKLAVAVRTS